MLALPARPPAYPPPPPEHVFFFRQVLENVKELWKEVPPGGKKPLTRDRVVPKMFLRGDSVIVVVSGESFKAASTAGAGATA